VLIESESLESLKRALEHIRQRVAHYPFCDVGVLTCSFGATLHRVGEDIDTTIQRADKALYRAKENGRNQVQIEE
ncbi:MAG: diguanylate cyclase, partial [Sulfurimonas sp.]|nr:diguanylate cyclase [Sulfurimonas sp.]